MEQEGLNNLRQRQSDL